MNETIVSPCVSLFGNSITVNGYHFLIKFSLNVFNEFTEFSVTLLQKRLFETTTS